MPAAAPPAPPCRAEQLRLSLDGRDGGFDGMSHAGTEVSSRDEGADCMLPALPVSAFRDAHGRVFPAERKLHAKPEPALILRSGGRAASKSRWVSGAVYFHSRSMQLAHIILRIGTANLQAPLAAMPYGPAGKPFLFDQAPMHAIADKAGRSEFPKETPR